MRVASIGLVATLLAACGDDPPPPPPPQPVAGAPAPAAAPAPGAPAAPGAPGTKLASAMRIENTVVCKTPPNTKPCDPNSVVSQCVAMKKVNGVDVVDESKPKQYCLQAGNGWFCGPCPERDGIRRPFKPRDFVQTADARDPFGSPLMLPTGIQDVATTSSLPREVTQRCQTEEQLIATSYSYQDLKLVGLVARGTQRKVLMMGGPMGYIIKRGDCVGKEKAFVKDIGTASITFELSPEGATATVQEHAVELYPTQVSVRGPEERLPRTTAPVVAPPPSAPTAEQGAPRNP